MVHTAQRPALVLAPVFTDQDRMDAEAFARDVVTELNRAAVVATHSDLRVTEYAFIVVEPNLVHSSRHRHDTAGVTLYAEALAAGMTVFEVGASEPCAHCGGLMTIAPTDEAGVPTCVPCLEIGAGCSLCGTVEEDCTPVEAGDGVFVPVCHGCAPSLAAPADAAALAVSL
jgi:hypothetical protein